MKELTYDVAIIGAGTAGLSAYKAVKRAGKNAVLIEADKYGTLCARVGCMPSKLLIHAANIAETIEHADIFGIRVPDGVVIDAPAVFGRVRKERDRFVNATVKQTEEIPSEFRLCGRAHFTDPDTLQVDCADGSVLVKAHAFVLGTGSTSRIPDEVQNVSDRLLISDDVFEFNEVPKTLAILGPGIIGLELGQALQRLGARVTFFSPFGDIGTATDPAIQKNIHEVFRKTLDFQLNCQKITTNPAPNNQVEIQWISENGDSHTQIFEKLLVTTGRIPNVSNLGLENTGIKLNKHGVPEFDHHTMRCGDSKIFIAGDMTGHLPVLHVAADEGNIAGTNAANFPDVQEFPRSTSLSIVFTEPQMATIGPRFKDLDPDDIEIGEVSYENQGRATMLAQNQGIVRLYGCRKTGRLLAAEMFAPGVEHTAHLMAWAVDGQNTVDELLERPFYHPVLEEGLRTALRRLSNQLNKNK